MADPLVFRIRNQERLTGFPLPSAGRIPIRTSARALAGMQKEAIVEYGATGARWRMVCDEGPWLNGTDLAPFPLAFFAAGLAASCLSEFVAESGDRGITIESLSLQQDNFYSMEGSALQGTMTAGVMPVAMQFAARGDAEAAEFADIARVAAMDRSAAVRCLSDELPGEFALQINGRPVSTGGVPAEAVDLTDPAALFESIEPQSVMVPDEDLIRKLADSEPQPGTAGGAAGLQPNQKRTVHVRTHGRVRSDGMKVLTVQCIQPAGSVFEFLSDNSAAVGGQERAPSGLALFSCGLAFCFMTQISRYAQIAKQDLHACRVMQATGFQLVSGDDPAGECVRTLVCLDTGEAEEKTRLLARMGEQTCYLHAAYRSATDVRVSFEQRG